MLYDMDMYIILKEAPGITFERQSVYDRFVNQLLKKATFAHFHQHRAEWLAHDTSIEYLLKVFIHLLFLLFKNTN